MYRQIKWFTTMVGRKVTLKTVLAAMPTLSREICAIRTTPFLQGKQARWGVAWSFDPTTASAQAVESSTGGQDRAMQPSIQLGHDADDMQDVLVHQVQSCGRIHCH